MTNALIALVTLIHEQPDQNLMSLAREVAAEFEVDAAELLQLWANS